MAYVLHLGQAHGDEAWRSGPKSANLSALKSAGFSVPDGFVLTTDTMDHHLAANGLTAQTTKLLDELDAASPGQLANQPEALRKIILSSAMPDDLAAALREALRELGGVPVSVRSSSTMEDRPDASFAGQHDTLLNVRGEEALEEAVKQCWASLWTDRAMHYMLALGISPKQIKMGVLVQKMVEADVAGVAFSINPLNGNASQASVSATYGLGEAVVSGQVTPDHALVQRDPMELVDYTIGSKSARVGPQDSGGTTTIAIASEQQAAACLNEAQVFQVAELALQVEEQMHGVPQDVEWALRGETLHLLQARPMVHTASPDEGVRWESPVPGANWRRNWRLGEWLAEPVTPLFNTWVLALLVEAREEQGTGELGWEMRSLTSMPQPWSCIVNGYLYSRQDRPPGFGMSGEQPVPPERLMRMAIGNTTSLARWRNEYLPEYLKRLQKHLRFDIAGASSQELVAFIETLARESGDFWYLMAPIGYGFEEIIFKPFYEDIVPEEQRPPHPVLFMGYPSKLLEGQELLYSLAQQIKENAGLVHQLVSSDPQAIAGSLDQLPAWLSQGLQRYWDEYGHEVYSLDFYFPTVGETPEATIAAMQGYLQFDTPSPQKVRKQAAQRREAAVQQVTDALANRPEDQETLRTIIGGYQSTAASREDAGFYFQRPWPLIRRSVLELGQRLTDGGVLQETAEVFFLEKEELSGVLAALNRDEPVPSLHDVAVGRRHTWDRHRRLSAPDRIPMDQTKHGLDVTSEFVQDSSGARIIGFPAAQGVALGPARVLHTTDAAAGFAKGDVLVTITATPAYTPLLLLAGALVTEAGGGASHSTLIAREMGIPVVSNAAQATELIRNGQTLEVDGNQGVVRLLT
jgi:phosphohistidine swiveling domain-containing protein